jgi:DedD protein
MLTRPEAGDPAVEELKRRARRRLVGAIVLALAAAVILPLLLESDPKPLGDDVSIRIPPIDSGKFITPLSPAQPPDAKSPTEAKTVPVPASASASATSKPTAVATDSATGGKAVGATETSNPPLAASQDAPAAVVPETDATPASIAAAQDAEAQKPSTPATKDANSEIAPPPTTAPAAPAGNFVVQVAAFADAKAAPALASKLKSAGYAVYVDTVKTQKGVVNRVRVGPFAARASADAALDKLKAAGYRGVVTTK